MSLTFSTVVDLINEMSFMLCTVVDLINDMSFMFSTVVDFINDMSFMFSTVVDSQSKFIIQMKILTVHFSYLRNEAHYR
ncbi:MAG: hypothetical protein LBL33_07975, partial [Tannerella sp.]|nr:hypothetical protein [Tannerella sp.]